MRHSKRVHPGLAALVAVNILSGSACAPSGTDEARRDTAQNAEQEDALVVAVGAMSSVRGSPTATLLEDGRVLIFGGGTGSAADLYDPVTGTFSLTAPAPQNLYVHGAVRLDDGRVLTAGGMDSSGSIYGAQSLLYDPSVDAWSVTDSLANPRTLHSTTLLADGRVLVLGGATYGSKTSTELYDPVSETWSTGPAVPDLGLYGHTATLLGNGKVLVAGGFSSYGHGAYLFDPETSSWSITGAPERPQRHFHRAFLLNDGRVLVVGGLDRAADFSVLANSEIYDPVSESWSPAGVMLEARYQFDGAVLACGAVLVFGGFHNQYLSSVERFDPSTGSWSTLDPLPRMLGNHTAVRVSPSSVLVAGGLGNPSSAEALLYEDDECGAPAVEDAPPEVSLLAPVQAQIIDRHLRFKAQVADDLGVARVEFFANHSSVGVVTAPPYELGLKTHLYEDGPLALEVVAQDTSGQLGSSGLVEVIVQNDLTPPIILPRP